MPGRLVVVVQNFPAPEDRRVWALATAAQRADWDVTVVSPALRGHTPGRGVVDGVALRWFRGFEGRGAAGAVAEALSTTALSTRVVLSERLRPGDVLHVCTPPDSLGPLLKLHARRGVGTLYDQHDVVPLLAAEKRGHDKILPLYDAMERATVRASSAVVTAGQVQADRLASLYGVTPMVVRTAAPLLGIAHDPPAQATVLGYLGVLGEQDGVDRLVQAAAILRDRGVAVTVRVAGDGPELPRLRAMVGELRLGDVVELCGWLQEAELEGFLAGVHGFVVPDPVTEFNDSCPMLKVSHALGAGLPVVMTPLKENLALTGGAGFVATGDTPAALAEAIGAWAASDRATRLSQGEVLRDRWRSELDPAIHMARYVAALDSAVAGARPSPSRR